MKLFLLSFVALAVLSWAAPTPGLLDPDRPGANRRGISYNDGKYCRDFLSGNTKTTWKYNWDSTDGGGGGTWHDYVPMLFSDDAWHTSRFWGNVDKAAHVGPFTTHVLGFNEPDLCSSGGSCMQDTGRAVAAYRQWMTPLHAKYGENKLKLGSPAVTNSGAPWGLKWLEVFLQQCHDCNIDFIAIHWYDSAKNTAYFKQHIKDARAIAGGRPIWITEFGPGGTEKEIIDFLHEILPWLDSQPDIHRYAMQWADPKGLLIKPDGSGLSNIGNVYNSY